MIRIDEIYTNTLFAWLKTNRYGMRSFHCHPIGQSSPESLYCQGTTEVWEHNYITFFDVEPINLEVFRPTFDKIRYDLAIDIHDRRGIDQVGIFVSSEHNSENVEKLCSIYGWQPRHYFFWGWAAMDWYRGYNLTFLMKAPEARTITKTFISPNRIVGGARSHRVELLYYIFKNKLLNNWISCPAVCPVEGTTILDIVHPLTNKYPDIEQVFANQKLPLNFPNETGHPMHSCWLSLFDESADSLLYLVSETIATGRRHQLTEKIFKPICLRMPFILHSTHGSLKYLRSYGFKTFSKLWDESYDNEIDDTIRIKKIANLITNLDLLSVEEKQDLFNRAIPIVEHNYNHFYNGGFKDVLWKELTEMLESLDTYEPDILNGIRND
jgi:hypothetical protein